MDIDIGGHGAVADSRAAVGVPHRSVEVDASTWPPLLAPLASVLEPRHGAAMQQLVSAGQTRLLQDLMQAGDEGAAVPPLESLRRLLEQVGSAVWSLPFSAASPGDVPTR